ncbi:uncharacterized protein PG986_008601 [Apiospora aurea]|uniref:Uncharacterized protein n=1 Tax=Apiospora aurea TaxID=335848 RepID=A0ABR1Q5B0_9PEZI
MFARSAALRSSIRATRVSPARISQKPIMGARKYATEPEPTPKRGGIPDSGNKLGNIAIISGVGIAGMIALLTGNPDKAQEVGLNHEPHPQEIAKERKYNKPRGYLVDEAVSPARGHREK